MEGSPLGFRIGFALDSHWIRTGDELAETWVALRWVPPVGLLYDATDLGGTQAMVHVRLDLADLEWGSRHVGRHGGDGRRGAPGMVCEESSDRLSKADQTGKHALIKTMRPRFQGAETLDPTTRTTDITPKKNYGLLLCTALLPA